MENCESNNVISSSSWGCQSLSLLLESDPAALGRLWRRHAAVSAELTGKGKMKNFHSFAFDISHNNFSIFMFQFHFFFGCVLLIFSRILVSRLLRTDELWLSNCTELVDGRDKRQSFLRKRLSDDAFMWIVKRQISASANNFNEKNVKRLWLLVGMDLFAFELKVESANELQIEIKRWKFRFFKCNFGVIKSFFSFHNPL